MLDDIDEAGAIQPDEEEGPEESAPAVFSIDSDDKAEWYLRKLASFEAEEARIEAQAATMLGLLKTRREGFAARFGPEFEVFAREKVAARGDGKKYHDFFQGRVSFRAVAASVRISSPEDALTTARLVCPQAIQTIEKLDQTLFRAKAKQVLEDSGELLPGVEMVPGREAMSIKFPTGTTGRGKEEEV